MRNIARVATKLTVGPFASARTMVPDEVANS